MRTIAASTFKAQCLALLDEVALTGEPILVLKRGRPVAKIVPSTDTSGKYPQDGLEGTVEILGDVVSPVLAPEDWEAEGQ
jgi:prevent-host-death family protein